MPKRQYIIEYKSEEVQGDDSFVKLRQLKYGDSKARAKEATALDARQKEIEAILNSDAVKGKSESELAKLRKELETIGEKQAAMGDQLMIDHIAEWNWVDDEGKPLPLPKTNPEVIDELMNEEIRFLTRAITGDSEDRKN